MEDLLRKGTVMSKRTIYMTLNDVDRLDHLLISAAASATDPDPLDALHGELDKAKIVHPEEVPPDVVTMNSKVRLKDMDTGETKTLTLVFPEDADPGQERVSVLEPIGTALIGYRVGDEIRWQRTGTSLHLKVEEILYQPEAAGDYHL